MPSLTVMSYALIVLATVPAAPPTAKNHRPPSWPAPISAMVPYQARSRLSWSAFWPADRGSVGMGQPARGRVGLLLPAAAQSPVEPHHRPHPVAPRTHPPQLRLA